MLGAVVVVVDALVVGASLAASYATLPEVDVLTIAMMPARITGGRVGHAAMTAASSGSVGGCGADAGTPSQGPKPA